MLLTFIWMEDRLKRNSNAITMCILFTFTFIQSNLQIRKSNYLKLYKYYIYTHKKKKKINENDKLIFNIFVLYYIYIIFKYNAY